MQTRFSSPSTRIISFRVSHHGLFRIFHYSFPHSPCPFFLVIEVRHDELLLSSSFVMNRADLASPPLMGFLFFFRPRWTPHHLTLHAKPISQPLLLMYNPRRVFPFCPAVAVATTTRNFFSFLHEPGQANRLKMFVPKGRLFPAYCTLHKTTTSTMTTTAKEWRATRCDGRPSHTS